MTVDVLPAYLKDNWRWIRSQLLEGSYQPRPVKRVEIPKPGSQEKRQLGMCVGPVHPASDSAHQAIAKAQSYVQ